MSMQILPSAHDIDRTWSIEAAASPELPLSAMAGALRQAFDVDFVFFDADTGECLRAAEPPAADVPAWGPLARVVGERGSPEIIVDDDPVLVLAVPLAIERSTTVVAVAAFAGRAGDASGPQTAAAAAALEIDEQAALDWLRKQTPWSPDRLLRTAQTVRRQIAAELRSHELRAEVTALSHHVARAYEEITLVYRLTNKLKLTQRDDELCCLALEWLAAVVPAQSLAVLLLPVAEAGTVRQDVRVAPELLAHGKCPIDGERFLQLAKALGIEGRTTPVVLNERHTSAPNWPFAAIRQLVVAPLCEGPHCFGYLAALNHAGDAEFGTVEASLIGSVATILGIHSGNKELYRQQEELLASTVRALTSAIDAKDPYTCGHSDRVARVAVRLAQELGFSAEEVRTIYLAGLLHDIGKIGIDDEVLRKPGKLTAAEFDHIKTHVVIGHRILADIRQLGMLLPAVLHHHEQWNGSGYPHGLIGDTIPLIARVMAVADAFDAMSSDRPYRPGMPAAKLDEVFRSGAGKQWDAQVVAAFFRARADIQAIADSDCLLDPNDPPQWT